MLVLRVILGKCRFYFGRSMRCQLQFCKVSETFSEIPAFRPKSSWLSPKGHASLEIFLCQLEKELLQMILMSNH